MAGPSTPPLTMLKRPDTFPSCRLPRSNPGCGGRGNRQWKSIWPLKARSQRRRRWPNHQANTAISLERIDYARPGESEEILRRHHRLDLRRHADGGGTYWVAKMGDKPVADCLLVASPNGKADPNIGCLSGGRRRDARVKKATAAGAKLISQSSTCRVSAVSPSSPSQAVPASAGSRRFALIVTSEKSCNTLLSRKANGWRRARRCSPGRRSSPRQRDQISAARRELPWVKVEKPYVFDGPDGKETLADLFGGRSQLLVYHFMLGPDWGRLPELFFSGRPFRRRRHSPRAA